MIICGKEQIAVEASVMKTVKKVFFTDLSSKKDMILRTLEL
jgi:hypothetical protein